MNYLKNGAEQIVNDQEHMARDFFADLHTKYQQVNPEIILNLVKQKVSAEMNQDLCKYFTDKEISDATFQIGLLKAPGMMVFFSKTGCHQGGHHQSGQELVFYG